MSQVFLSYNRWSRPFAERLKIDLERAGWQVWLDLSDIPLGVEWEREIRQGISTSEHALILWSPQAATSIEVARELELIRASGLRSLPLLLAGDEQSMPAEMQARQFLDFRRDYWQQLPALLAWLQTPEVQLRSAFELLGNQTTQAQAYRELGGTRQWTVAGQRFLGVPLQPSAYCSAMLVAAEDDPFQIADDIQIMLKFTGEAERANTITEVLEFLLREKIRPNLVFVTGPRDYHTGKHFIPNDQPTMWADAVRFCHNLIYRLARGKHPRLFLEAPQTLAFLIAGRLREMISYRLYQFDYDADGSRRYQEVWNSREH